MLPFEHDLVKKVEKVRQRSTSNFSEILMWRISLSNYEAILAIPAELSCSQGSWNVSKFESSKRLHKGKGRTRSRSLCREHPYSVTTWSRQFMKSYCIRKVTDVARHMTYNTWSHTLTWMAVIEIYYWNGDGLSGFSIKMTIMMTPNLMFKQGLKITVTKKPTRL